MSTYSRLVGSPSTPRTVLISWTRVSSNTAWYFSRRNGVASPMARVMLAAVSARKFAIASSGIGDTGASE